MRIGEVEASRVAVFGFGRTGRAVVEFLLRKGIEPFVTDAGSISDEAKGFLSSHSVSYEDGGHTLRAVSGVDLIVLSPGVDPRAPILGNARSRGIPILSELDLAGMFLPRVPIIGVTGTNGKSTTVRLIEAILRAQGRTAVSGGNIGIPAISLVGGDYDVLVLEVSSFQLEQSSAFHPRVGVLLNIAPDHLDRHRTMAAYTAAKLRLFRNQTRDDLAVAPTELAAAVREIEPAVVFYDRLDLSPLPGFERLLFHNRLNLKAAVAAARGIVEFDPLDLDLEGLVPAFSLPYRMRVEGEVGGALVINDSKSTNAAATIAALRGFDRPVVLILGGRHKGAGYEELAREIAGRRVKQVVLYGEAASYLEERLHAAGIVPAGEFPDLEGAVECALDHTSPGDVLLFSPACSSYDLFKNYEERGMAFSSMIRAHPFFRARMTD